MPHVLAISNQKGGVAKTTSALTIAAQFAKSGKRVLAIDLDSQANLTLGLGLGSKIRDRSSQTILDVLLEDCLLSEAFCKTKHKGLETLTLIPANRRLARAETELKGQVGFDALLRDQLAELEDFDCVVLDCPPSLGVLTMNALVAADRVLVPVQCEFFSISGLASLLDLVKVVKKRRNEALQLTILPTLYDRRNRICRDLLAELRKRFQEQLSGVVIDVDTRLREAAADGRPISLFAPKSRANKQYASLAKELLVYAHEA